MWMEKQVEEGKNFHLQLQTATIHQSACWQEAKSHIAWWPQWCSFPLPHHCWLCTCRHLRCPWSGSSESQFLGSSDLWKNQNSFLTKSSPARMKFCTLGFNRDVEIYFCPRSYQHIRFHFISPASTSHKIHLKQKNKRDASWGLYLVFKKNSFAGQLDTDHEFETLTQGLVCNLKSVQKGLVGRSVFPASDTHVRLPFSRDINNGCSELPSAGNQLDWPGVV